jgi:hypothetical protein
MQVVIRRNQADMKTFFGGHKGVAFSLYAKANVTPDERALIDRYKVGSQVVAGYRGEYNGKEQVMAYSIEDLVNGKTAELTSIESLLALEDSIKDGCRNLKTLLLVMSTFGGEEIIDI